MNLKELENLSLTTNSSLAGPTNLTRVLPHSGAVQTAKGADDISSAKGTSTSSKDREGELDFLTEMMTTQFHHPHHRAAFHQVCLHALLPPVINPSSKYVPLILGTLCSYMLTLGFGN